MSLDPKSLLVPGLLVLAVSAAWLATAGLGTVDVPDVPEASTPPVAPPEAADPDDLPTATVDGLRPPTAPSVTPSLAPPLAPPPNVVSGEPRSVPLAPEVSARIREATTKAAGRRVDMLERMFLSAPQAVLDDDEREQVEGVLDEAIGDLRALQARVASGDITYRDAATEMDAVRDAAGERVASIIPADEAATVKLRMGIRPPRDPAGQQPWDDLAFDPAAPQPR